MKTYIHIGNHKAGSTYFQKNIFPNIKNINYLGFYDSKYLIEEIRYIQTCSELFYKKEKIVNLESFLKKSKKNKEDILISSEAFSGSISTSLIGSCTQIEMISKRIKKIFDDPCIIIFLRNQRDAIYSLYKDDIQLGHTMSFNKWFKERKKNNALNYFLYYEIIKHYHEIFGKNNVKVFFYEELFANNGVMKFLKSLNFNIKNEHQKIISFEKTNESQSDFVIKLSRFINRLIPTKLSQGYTDGYFKDLWIYNLWRYKISSILNKLFYSKEILTNPKFENFITNCKMNNSKLKNIINEKIPEKYF